MFIRSSSSYVLNPKKSKVSYQKLENKITQVTRGHPQPICMDEAASFHNILIAEISSFPTPDRCLEYLLLISRGDKATKNVGLIRDKIHDETVIDATAGTLATWMSLLHNLKWPWDLEFFFSGIHIKWLGMEHPTPPARKNRMSRSHWGS